MSDGTVHNLTEWQWTPKKEKAILLLLEGMDKSKVAAEIGITRTTLYAWLKAPEFQSRLDELHSEIVNGARRILQRNAEKAAQQVVNIMDYGNMQHATRLQAANSILDRVGLKGKDKVELTGKNDGPIETKGSYDFSDAQLIQLGEAAAAAARARDAAQAGASAGDELADRVSE